MSTDRRFIYLVAALLLLSALACNTLTGSGQVNVDATAEIDTDNSGQDTDEVVAATDTPEGSVEVASPTPEDASSGDQQSEYPTPDDASNLTVLGEGQINFTTGLSMNDVVEFYRDQFTALGYTERTLLTVISDQAISMVFDGHASGKAIVLQAVDINGSTNVNLRLETVP